MDGSFFFRPGEKKMNFHRIFLFLPRAGDGAGSARQLCQQPQQPAPPPEIDITVEGEPHLLGGGLRTPDERRSSFESTWYVCKETNFLPHFRFSALLKGRSAVQSPHTHTRLNKRDEASTMDRNLHPLPTFLPFLLYYGRARHHSIL